MVRHNVFGPVAMVSIEIPDGDLLRPICECVEGGDSNIVEITKTHGVIARCMVTWWTHQTEGATALSRRARHVYGCAGCPCGVFKDVGISRRVRVEKIKRRV